METNGHAGTMTAELRAEYDREIAQMRAAVEFVATPPTPAPKPAKPRPKIWGVSEQSLARRISAVEVTELASRLLAMVAAESTVDREEHALGVARMILGVPS